MGREVKKRPHILMLRLADDELRKLDARVQRERQKHPGRNISRSGMMRELFMIALLAEPS